MVEWATMSVWTWSPRWNRTDIPCGLDPFGSLSAIVGTPADRENRMVTGVDGRVAWGARVRSATPGAGVNVPAYMVPRAWAGRNPGWTPPDSRSRTASRSGMRVADIVKRSAANGTTELMTGPGRADAEQRLFADLDPDTRAWALARYTPHPVAALEAPMELDGFWTQSWPATVIRCRRSVNPPESHQRRTAERLGAAWHELDAGHYPMLSHPDELTRLLL